jgi:S1-C subfamily serine protease
MVDTDHSEFAIREGAALALGLALATSPEGARVEQVLENRPASDAGIREGDVIRNVAGEIALTADRVFEVLDKFRPRSEVELSVLRDGKPRCC